MRHFLEGFSGIPLAKGGSFSQLWGLELYFYSSPPVQVLTVSAGFTWREFPQV